MIFDLFTDVVDSALSVVGDILEGETPSRRRVAELVSAGMTVAMMAEGFDVAESVIEELME